MEAPIKIRQPFVPPRRSEIAELARATFLLFGRQSIDAVAEGEGIELVRLADATATKEGFCCLVPKSRRKRLSSAARPGQYVFSFVEWEKEYQPAIIINPLKAHNEIEVFWHEYYHLNYSPSRAGGATFFGGYSSAGVLDKQEESRANLFAAMMIIPTVSRYDTIASLMQEYKVSQALATLRLQHR